MKLKALRAVKITPKLLSNFIQSPFKKVDVPCKYCPGICLSSCPTFIETGNINLSPLGYSRNKKLLRERCLKCWRCVSECPLKYPLPESSGIEIKLEVEILRKGDIMILSAEGLDDKYSRRLADLLNTGLLSVKGLYERYEEGLPLDPSSLKKVLKYVKKAGKVYTISPESFHALSLPLLVEKLSEFTITIDYSGPIHIPCLLTDYTEKILYSLQSIGIKPTEIIRDKCLKLGMPKALTLCPRGASKGLQTIYDYILD